MKPKAPTASETQRNKLRFGLPESSTERKSRIKAAIQSNRETLRRLAKVTLDDLSVAGLAWLRGTA